MRQFFSAQPVQVKFLIFVVPLTIALTVLGLGLVQRNAGNKAVVAEVDRFNEVGSRAADALAEEFWNYNTTQVQAIVDSLLLIPNIHKVETQEIAEGAPIPDSGLYFDVENSRYQSEDQTALRLADFPIEHVRDNTIEQLGELSITYSMAQLRADNQAQMRRTLYVSLPIALALIGGTLIALHRLFMVPISAVTRSSASGSLSHADADYEPIIWNSRDQLGVLVSAFNDLRENQVDSTRKLKQEQTTLKQRTIELAEQQARIKADLKKAAEIQLTLCPAERLQSHGNGDLTRLSINCDGIMQPAFEVGGDFFDYFNLPSGAVVMCVADACGKGAPAAIYAARVRDLIRLFAAQEDASELPIDEDTVARILGRVNRVIAANNTDCWFVTAWLGIAEPDKGRLTFASAGHCNALLTSRDHITAELPSATAFPLGIDEDFEVEAAQINLADISKLVIYSDGVTELKSGEDQMLGVDGLIDLMRSSNHSTGSSNASEDLLHALSELHPGSLAHDDMTILVANFEQKQA